MLDRERFRISKNFKKEEKIYNLWLRGNPRRENGWGGWEAAAASN